ncbi:MAG: carbohydrate-binding protein [Bacteroidia bacterium]
MNSIFQKTYLIAFAILLANSVFAQITIEAENYSAMNGIDLESTTDDGGGENVGWIDNNDWMEYDMEIPYSGKYEITSRYASDGGNGSIRFEIDGSTLTNQSFGSTGGWQNWQSAKSDEVQLTKGNVKLRVTATTGGFNLNWFQFHLVDPNDSDAPSAPVVLSSNSEVRSVSITWSGSTDPTTAVAGYRILNNNNYIGFTNATTFTLKRLQINTDFNFSIVACDVAGNYSSATTLSISTTEPDWDLVWNDEFDGTSIDKNKWYFETGNHGWGNGEAQNYTNGDNAFIKDGNLVIEARKENSNGSDFSSSRMNNTGEFDFLYGRIEVKAKLPSTGGTWPAIWTLPREWSYGTWPLCGEMDIMEHTGNNLNHVFGTIHTGAYNHSIGTQKGGGKNFDDVVNTYHTYVLEWYPDRLDWYYDEELVFTFENENKTYEEWPFDIPHYLKLNIAIGGGLGGNIDYNGVWPQQMTIDYVRVYDLGFGKNDSIPPSAPLNLKATSSRTNVELNWNVSTDNRYIENYYIYQDDILIDSVARNSYIVQFLDPETEYKFSIKAKDFAHNFSEEASTTVTTGVISGIEIPAKIEAENFDYQEGMETENCTDEGGGLNMAFIDNGDWLAYYINVKTAGTYYLAARTASESSGGSFDVEDSDNNKLTEIKAPATGGWQDWVTVVSDGFNLEEGIQKIYIRSTGQTYNINWIAITDDPSEYSSSIKELKQKKSEVFPNPVENGKLQIDFNENQKNLRIEVYSIEGKIVFSKRIRNAGTQVILNELNLPKGPYNLFIKSNKTEEYHRLIIQ